MTLRSCSLRWLTFSQRRTGAVSDINKPPEPALEALQRVQAARNNLLAATTGKLEPVVAGQLITGAVLLLDSAAQWLEGA